MSYLDALLARTPFAVEQNGQPIVARALTLNLTGPEVQVSDAGNDTATVALTPVRAEIAPATLSSDATSTLAFDLTTGLPSGTAVAVFGVRLFYWQTSSPTVAGAIDIIGTVTHTGTTFALPAPASADYSLLPAALIGVNVSVAATNTGLSVSVTRKPGLASKVAARLYFDSWEVLA